MYRKFIKINIIITALLVIFSRNSESSASHYTAGVVEFQPIVSGMSSYDMLMNHLNGYNEILRSPDANGTDIIVFPEGTLNNALQLTFVPGAEEHVIPCVEHKDFAEFFINISCTAREIRKYVVINLTEKENCSTVMNDPRPCSSSGLNIYNTNVVFDRDGRVISRYRKVHVYVEAKNTTLEPEFAIFETDFGVKFGHFVCFDMLFYTPAQELVDRFGLKNLIFTSMFYSELPFLTAVQLQQSWSWGNNVNLLAAGASYPQGGMTGSGIYAGKGGSLSTLMVTGEGGGVVRKLLVAQVPKEPPNDVVLEGKNVLHEFKKKSFLNNLKLMKDPQITNYQSKLLNFTEVQNASTRLCHGNLCCDFSASTEPRQTAGTETVFYSYRFGVFNGRRTYEKEEWSDIRVCALYACTNDTVESCGELFPKDVVVDANFIFKSIEISANLEKSKRMLIMPNTLNSELYSLQPESVEWTIKEDDTKKNRQVNFKLIGQQSDLLAFGIYAQYYEDSGSGEPSIDSLIFLLLILSSLTVQIVINQG